MKKDFPLLQQNLLYLDSAATTQKPDSVIKKIEQYYKERNANAHRGIYKLAAQTTEEYENTRLKIRTFFAIPEKYEIIFTKNATEALNLVAYSALAMKNGKVVSTIIEHHANFVPWQQRAKSFEIMHIKEGKFDTTPIDKDTVLVTSTLQSNVTGELYDPTHIIKKAKEVNALTVLDACQSAAHLHLDTHDADFLAFSAHKILGPTGLGILIAKKEVLNRMPPFLYGGEMIDEVTIKKTTFAKAPHKYEAGTMPIAQVIAFAKALEYIENRGKEKFHSHMQQLTQTFYEELDEIKEYIVTDQNYPRIKAPVFSLSHPTIHPYDIAAYMDTQNICIRAGHHCAMPYMTHKKITGTVRASAYVYNSVEDIRTFVKHYKESIKRLSR